METRPDTHPSPNVLRDFCLGKLGDALAETVLDHLETCSECCKEVAAQSGDSFLERLRQAGRPSNTPAPGVSLSGLAPSQGSRLRPDDSLCQFERGARARQPSPVRDHPRAGPRRYGRRLPRPKSAHGAA